MQVRKHTYVAVHRLVGQVDVDRDSEFVEACEVPEGHGDPGHEIIPGGAVLVPDGDDKALPGQQSVVQLELELFVELWVDVLLEHLGRLIIYLKDNLLVITPRLVIVVLDEEDLGVRVLTALAGDVLGPVQVNGEAAGGVAEGGLQDPHVDGFIGAWHQVLLPATDLLWVLGSLPSPLNEQLGRTCRSRAYLPGVVLPLLCHPLHAEVLVGCLVTWR